MFEPVSHRLEFAPNLGTRGLRDTARGLGAGRIGVGLHAQDVSVHARSLREVTRWSVGRHTMVEVSAEVDVCWQLQLSLRA